MHVWAFQSLLDLIPDRPWLVKHNSNELNQSLPKQLLWQATRLAGEVTRAGCDILFTTDASTFCRFKPMVVLSQDMLSYEPGVMKHLGIGKTRLRALSILVLQNMAFRFADGVIFLTRYAGKLIQQSCGILPRVTYIPHGVGTDFKQVRPIHPWPKNGERAFQCLYISNVLEYKNQWVVVRGIEILRKRGYDILLTLVGRGSGKAQRLLDHQIALSDPRGEFVQQVDFIPHKELPAYLAKNADLFVFASSCENMPITLLEGMSVGLPIACSDRGPMPEVLGDGGVYFDPEKADSISTAIENIITNKILRRFIAGRAKDLSQRYNWARCATETWDFLMAITRS